MGELDVTVVVPTKDRPELVRATVASVAAQRGVEMEIIVVDDGSEEAVVFDCPTVTVVRNDRPMGVSAARNAGLARARGRWIAFVDDDDLWAPDKLARQLAALDSEPSARWSCVGTAHVDDDLGLVSRALPPPSGDVADLVLARNVIPGGGSGVVASTRLVRDVDGFDEKLGLCADYDLWIRLALSAPMIGVHDPLLAYRIHALGMSRRLDQLRPELATIEHKYEAERRRRGVRHAGEVYLWAGDRLQRSGRRLVSAATYMRAAGFGVPTWLAVARAAEAALWPNGYRQRDRRRRATIPPEWLSALDAWLDPFRSR